jgi:hypothetical protein
MNIPVAVEVKPAKAHHDDNVDAGTNGRPSSMFLRLRGRKETKPKFAQFR